jgi:hypothetical protein
MGDLTANFDLAELTKSDTAERLGIDNTPGSVEHAALTRLAVTILQPIRELVGHAVLVHDAYRNAEVNKAVGGVPDSQHQRGEAADISAPPLTLRELFDLVRKSSVPYDQCILEETVNGGCVHISEAHWTSDAPRREALIRSAAPPWTYEKVED